jgi:hypothetical protein
MLKVYTTYKEEDKDRKKLDVSLDGDIIRLQINDNIGRYDVSKLEKNTIYKIFYDFGGFYPTPIRVQDAPQGSQIDRYRMYVGKDGNVLLSTSHKVTTTDEDCEIISVERNFSLRKAVCTLYPEYEKEENKVQRRYRIIDSLNANMSLAVIDAQLEIVTELLMAVVKNNLDKLDNESKALYEILEKTFEQNNLLNIKSIQSIQSEILDNKARIRKIQEYYYNEKR